MKKLTLLLLFALLVHFCFAQKGSIKGSITDTFSKQNLTHAVVSILRSKDSVLYKFTRSKEDGIFNLSGLNAGKYLMLVSYPSYADYYDTLTIQDNSNIDLGKVMLTTKAHLLSDVTVVQKIAAVRMKGDTIVYKADSFKVKEGASVEDLLKKFPGIQVDKNGNITAQGTKVEKVMVDGEEFFGDDPTIATKNLNAKMVNEVQVFDKKSDQATFTGIDDGQTTRTINLKLKDDAKKGWFGKVEAGAGPNDVWNNSLMANSFKKKRKFSVYGIASSTGKTGLNWDERGKYGDQGGGDMQMTDDGSMFMSYGGGDGFDNSNYWGEGIPKSWSAGLNYANKFQNDKQSLNGSYRYSKIINNGGGSTVSQSILPDTLFFNHETRNVYGNKDRHSMNGSFDWMVDSFFSAKLSVVGTKGTVNGYSNYYSDAMNAFNKFVNTSRRNVSSAGDNQSFKSSLLLRKRFKKIGRTLSLNIDQAFNESNTDGFLYSLNDYYDKTETIFRRDTTDQKKINGINSNTLNSRLAYTEQLAKNTTLEVSYGININKYENKILSYDKTAAGKYDALNTKYSNDYDFNIITNKVGSTIRFNKKKVNISLGGDIAFAAFKQKDLLKDSVTKYNYTNLFPRANFVYKFNANKRVTVSYNGSTRQPSIQQIQPVADNTNPLFVQLGNANLKQEFNHRINLNMNNYQVLKNRGYWLGINYNFTENAIRSNQFTDSVGKTTSQYINANGNNNYGGNLGYNCKLQKLDMDFNISYSYNVTNSTSFVNALKNDTRSTRHNININLGKEKEKLYNVWLWSGINYNMSTSSIRPEINTNYWSVDLNIDFNLQLPWKLELNNSIETEIRQKTQLFSGNNNVTVWNSYLARKILKNDKGQIRISAFDILDQNRGYRRSINSTTLTENTYQQLAQYFLLSFVWNFSKGGMQK